MSDEVIQPIEQPEPADALSSTDAKPEILQAPSVETLPEEAPATASETEALPVEIPPISEPVSLPEPVILPPPVATESIQSETISNPISIPKEEPVVVIPAQNPPVVEEIQPLFEPEGYSDVRPESSVPREPERPNPLVRGNNPPPFSPLDAIASAFKNNMARARELLVKARMAIQIKKKKKLEKVMNLFLTKKKIKNSDVRDLLHITDETATVYLNILKKEGKIQPNGKGGWIYYTKV